MRVTELIVLYVLNSLQPSDRDYSQGFAPVTAKEITTFINRGFRHPGQSHSALKRITLAGTNWKPTKGEVVATLTRLRGLGEGFDLVRRNVRRKDHFPGWGPLVYAEKADGEPYRYGLTHEGVQVLCR